MDIFVLMAQKRALGQLRSDCDSNRAICDWRSRHSKVGVIPEGHAVSAQFFETEFNWDKLTVNGWEYHGSEGPVGIQPTGDITWSSD